MQLYLVRHGVAQERTDEDARPDSERHLTPRGRQRTARVAEGLAALGCSPDRIATSPLCRCDETARILAKALCGDASYEVCAFLAPGAEAAELVAWLRQCEGDSVMVVGHMPDVAEIASDLLATGGGVRITFKKAAVCCIVFDGPPGEGAGRLQWLLQPRQFRALAGDRKDVSL